MASQSKSVVGKSFCVSVSRASCACSECQSVEIQGLGVMRQVSFAATDEHCLH